MKFTTQLFVHVVYVTIMANFAKQTAPYAMYALLKPIMNLYFVVENY